MKNAKIIATIGPASRDVQVIFSMLKAGMNIARVNMSHGTYETHLETICNIRKAAQLAGREVGILLDLQGPKIRVDKLDSPLILHDNEQWVIATKSILKKAEQTERQIPTIYEHLADDCKVGDRVLFDDGKMTAKVVKKEKHIITVEISHGGELKSNKGINLPDTLVSAPSFTIKDQEDLQFAIQHGIDFVALSFVRSKQDVLNVKYMLHQRSLNIPVIAKIENPQAVDNLDEIIANTDGIMVARGDMGVELGNHRVPAIQKMIIEKCNKRGIPVITATQMLESMINEPTPTRAEASDVANAIWDGTDAVMLSAETASGEYPLEAVKMMSSIIKEAEKHPKARRSLRDYDLSNIPDAIMVAASLMAEKIGAKRIVAITQSGHSCLAGAKYRPQVTVIGITSSVETARRLSLYWGVYPYLVPSKDMMYAKYEQELIATVTQKANLKAGDRIVITRGGGDFFQQELSQSVRALVIGVGKSTDNEDSVIKEYPFINGRILHNISKCISCSSCVGVCPHQIWYMKVDEEGSLQTLVNTEKVNDCNMDNTCVRICSQQAIEIISMKR